MSQKRIYIYRLEAGYDKKPPEVVEYFYASNSKKLIQYAHTLYSDRKFNRFKTVKLGFTKNPETMRRISPFESEYFREHMTAEQYSERVEP